jgi:ankyrin repeat protein
MSGSLSSVKYLLKHGASITERDDDGMTALLWAAEEERLEVIQYLLSSEGGARIAETDNAGHTALLLAAAQSLSPIGGHMASRVSRCPDCRRR